VAAAVALANLDVLEREDLLGHVRREEPALRSLLEGLRDIDIVGDVRGAGFFWGIELVADPVAKTPLDADAAAGVVGFLGPELYRRGLICRAVDRGYPVIQLAPPLVAGPAQFAEIASIVRGALEAAAARIGA
jgi:adenosylmethionine-8-amino-7-oxononanoate aminotransferase